MTPLSRYELLLCIDRFGVSREERGTTSLEGWIASPAGISRALVRSGSGDVMALRLGFNRPDVLAAFPELEGSRACGWHGASLHGIPVQAGTLEVHVVTDSGERLIADIRSAEGEIQRAALRPAAASTFVGVDALAETVTPLESEALEKRLTESLARKRGLTLRLDLINKCNLRCVMCHYSDSEIFKRPVRHITAAQFEAFFEDIAPDVREVVLSCGDEPLISPNLEPVLRYLSSRHPEVEVVFTTNAMLLNERAARMIVECAVSQVTFSIDGVTASTLESIRTGSRFAQVIGNLSRLKAVRDAAGSCRPLLAINFVMMRSNIAEAPAMVDAAAEIGVHFVDFRHVVPSGYFHDPQEMLEHHPGLFNLARERILDLAHSRGVGVYMPPALPCTDASAATLAAPPALDEFRAAVAAVGPISQPPQCTSHTLPTRSTAGTTAEEFSGLFCERPFTEIMVRNQDEILPCAWHRKVLGHLGEGKSLREIFLGESFSKLRANMLRPDGDPDCAGCPVKSQLLPTSKS
jgi:MoaA/NifB/PqqE/SkfB family radical SAM enzyme